MKNFALIGAAGYIAPRHIKAIADTGNNLLVAYDKFDSVGRLDSSFPECSFFTENEQFDRFCSKQMRTDNPLSWVSICTPNYTHDAFIRYGLRLGCNVICEKPLVLNPYNIDNLVELEQETGCEAYTILQLRLHDKIAALREKVQNGPKDIIGLDSREINPQEYHIMPPCSYTTSSPHRSIVSCTDQTNTSRIKHHRMPYSFDS